MFGFEGKHENYYRGQTTFRSPQGKVHKIIFKNKLNNIRWNQKYIIHL